MNSFVVLFIFWNTLQERVVITRLNTNWLTWAYILSCLAYCTLPLIRHVKCLAVARKRFNHVYQPKAWCNNNFSEVAQVFWVSDLPAAIQLAGAACNNKVRGVCCAVFWLETKYSVHVNTSATTVPRGPELFYYNINKYLTRQKQRWKKVWIAIMTTDPLALFFVW